nr:MAG TPA_asm: hypothetical protein [Caudoviricetes sp.]
MFDFKQLIAKYTKGVTYLMDKGEGYYDPYQAGKYIEAEPKLVKLSPAAIVPLSDDDLKFVEGGVVSSDDRKLYCYKRIKKGSYIVNVMADRTKSTYRIMGERDYSDFDVGLHIYMLERTDNYDWQT